MPHHDASTFTINIALNRVGVDYEVGSLQGGGGGLGGRAQGTRGPENWREKEGLRAIGKEQSGDTGVGGQPLRTWGPACPSLASSVASGMCLGLSVSPHLRWENVGRPP